MTAMRTPQQQRSRRTRERMLAAVEALLEQHTFEALTVQQIVRRARACVGSFYHLFGDKDRLLAALYERHAADIGGRLERLLEDSAWTQRGLQAGVQVIVAEMIGLHERQRGLLRTLVLRGHTGPQRRPPGAAAGEMSRVLPRLAERLAQCAARDARAAGRGAPAGSEWEAVAAAGRVGLLMALATLREVYLYPQTTANPAEISPNELRSPLETALRAVIERAAAAA